ncbi:MAG: DUF1549 domain-containing protein, partial [Limisphaerales bacterium]
MSAAAQTESSRLVLPGVVLAVLLVGASYAPATPANRAALEHHYDRFLAKEVNRCTTCHLPSERKEPKSLEDFPHNAFGQRLHALGTDLTAAGKPASLAARLALVAREDSDGDGVPNETELLLGKNPGDAKDKPPTKELSKASAKQAEFAKFLAAYRWRPFETVARLAVPVVKNGAWGRNPVDAFVAAEHEARGLKPRPEATKEVLLRRVYLDLIGLNPTPEEQRQFLADTSSDAYEKVVNRLLDDPRHGERWGRHWMDVWRYSDWAGWSGGNQIRDSKPHIWRWRDWIVESLNKDKGYDRMVLEMLAADEVAPLDTDALRATGFLVRNFKMLSREQWMEDTLKHTSQAFLGVTVGCAKCHDHMVDPISQREYYQLRAVFDPHDVRTDRIPGQLDTAKDGLVRAFDKQPDRRTHLLIRGDERTPDTNKVMEAGVPFALCGLTSVARTGGKLAVEPVRLPLLAVQPDQREFVFQDTLAASERGLADAREAFAKLKTSTNSTPEKLKEQELTLAVTEAKHTALAAVIRAEKLEVTGRKDSDDWKRAATEAVTAQRQQAVADARLKLHQTQNALVAALKKADSGKPVEPKAPAKKGEKAADPEALKKQLADNEKALAAAEKDLSAAPATAFKPRTVESYPATSTGRRLAFAQWVADAQNPLTARVAVNQMWLRHFGRGIVPTPADFGRNGRPPSHPQLLDWLASEFVARGWSMKAIHRLLVTSSTYRMASTPDVASAKLDQDNFFLWRMNSRRLEAEAVRDNLLFVCGSLDLAMGGPEIDHNLGLSSKRRSVYLRLAAEKEVEFLKIFDGPAVTECYERRPSVMPQQALALANSELAQTEARRLAKQLATDDDEG